MIQAHNRKALEGKAAGLSPTGRGCKMGASQGWRPRRDRREMEHVEPIVIGGREFLWGHRTYIMAILNVSADSFAGDGVGYDVEEALERARRMAQEGADILDVGGESTRPGAAPVDVEEERRRVLPVIRRLARELAIPISIDTYKAEVAEVAIKAGAHMVNDIWGFRQDPEMAPVVAHYGVPAVVMHNQRGQPATDVAGGAVGGTPRDSWFRGDPAGPDGSGTTGRAIPLRGSPGPGGLGTTGRAEGPGGLDTMEYILAGLRRSLAIAREAGVEERQLIVDPGFGFGWTVAENLDILRRLGEMRALGRPILVGTSRKSTIGHVLGLPVEERLEGTAATVAVAIAAGADVVRVHDVKAMARVCRMTDAVVRGWEGPML